jgi:hypothetical protein
LSDDELLTLQRTLLACPDGGDVIEGTGGLRKLRFADARRGKGTRLRVIYGLQFWLFAIYAKGEVSDLTAAQRRMLRTALKTELSMRRLDG